ncbi:sensor histidine kinase [uncultured Ruminococcus sp.]|uniref:sensor histidine kinase n=1 Tax=uncultured Ruminococcus sp. TaxID=165186 RepID=UPI0025CFD0CD|nr:GHKL domain-containing protein [uncultured Ruminococcus sp.]
MKTIAQFSIILIGLIYGTAFSFVTLVTLGDLFYRKVRRVIGFPVITGVIFGIAEFLQNRFLGGVDLLPLYLLHTAAAIFLLADRSKENIISLICAELFSGCMIGSMQTAVFSVTNGAKRSFVQVTLLYLTGYLAAALFVFLLKRLVRSEDREPLGLLQIVLLTGIACVVTMLVNNSFTMSDYIPDVSPEAAIPSVLMLMSVSVLLLLSVKTDQAKRFREMNELNEKYMTAQAKHFEQSRVADTGMRMLRHDMKNHITVMNGLFDSGKTDELGEYLKELGTAFADTQSVNITGNEIADAIIYEKKNYAEMNGASLVTEGSLKGLEISAVTLCTVLSNLLDNAIEAAVQTDSERVIMLSAKRSGSFFYICISNPTANYVDVSADIPTSKPDSAGHGLGLKSVRKAIEKCGGTLELSCKGSVSGYIFTAEVILPAEQ